MKFLDYLFVLLMFFALSIPAYSSNVLCNSNKSVCTVGNYTFRGQNIYVEDGIMCTANKSICTNGDTILKTSDTSENKDNKKAVSSNKKGAKAEIVSMSETETLAMVADLYKKGYVTQFEFNRVKSDLQIIQTDELEELTKLANLYKNGFITQFEFNNFKRDIFK